MRGMLQVAHLRHLPFRADLDADAARRWALEESASRAAADVDAFMAELTRAGWQHQKVLLSSAERAPFAVEGGAEGGRISRRRSLRAGATGMRSGAGRIDASR